MLVELLQRSVSYCLLRWCAPVPYDWTCPALAAAVAGKLTKKARLARYSFLLYIVPLSFTKYLTMHIIYQSHNINTKRLQRDKERVRIRFMCSYSYELDEYDGFSCCQIPEQQSLHPSSVIFCTSWYRRKWYTNKTKKNFRDCWRVP